MPDWVCTHNESGSNVRIKTNRRFVRLKDKALMTLSWFIFSMTQRIDRGRCRHHEFFLKGKEYNYISIKDPSAMSVGSFIGKNADGASLSFVI